MWDTARSRTSENRYQPRIGRAFELEDAHLIDARSRGFLVRAITFGAGAAVAITGTYGLVTGSYIAAEVVWAVAGPMLGAVTTHYFGSAGKDVR
jgi:hypothetical protein